MREILSRLCGSLEKPPRERERKRELVMTRDDLITLCDEAINQLEYEKLDEGLVWNNLIEIRATLVNEGE